MEGKKESEERQRETDEKYYAEKWVEGFRSYLDRELENANPFETITGFEIKQKVPKGALELLQQKEKRVDGFERIPSGTGWNVVLKH